MKTKISISQWLLDCSRASKRIEASLRASRPRFEVPGDLREEIMCRVRATSRLPAPPPPARSFHIWRWLAVPGAAVIVVFALVTNYKSSLNSKGPEASLRAASQVLGTEERIAGEFTAAMVGPLNEELNRIDGDIKRAAEHLLASLP
jgi:hypothetical protein